MNVIKTTNITFSEKNYYQEIYNKKQIYLHHTGSNGNAKVIYDWWNQDNSKIATCVVISNSGEIIQGFSSKYWAYHLGVKKSSFTKLKIPYVSLDKISIGVEICNWGPLTFKNNKFYNYINQEIPFNQVTSLDIPYKGYKYYQSYSNPQIESLKNLLLYWKEKYGIPLEYNRDIWKITPRAFKQDTGIFTHNSVRDDKTDVYPHPEIVNMLEKLWRY